MDPNQQAYITQQWMYQQARPQVAYQTAQYPTTMYQVSRPMAAPVQYLPTTSLPTSYVQPAVVPVMRQQVYLQPGAVRPAMFHVVPQQQMMQPVQPMQPMTYSQAPMALPMAAQQQHQHLMARPAPVHQQPMVMLPPQHVVQQPSQRARISAPNSHQFAQKRMRYAAVLPHALLASRAQQVRTVIHHLFIKAHTLHVGQCHGAAPTDAAKTKGSCRPHLPDQVLRCTC